MNRVSGDYLETLLYKVFVSIDERTSVAELANVLDVSLAVAKVKKLHLYLRDLRWLTGRAIYSCLHYATRESFNFDLTKKS